MAEEDLIFGKNRHYFGGIEPSNMIKFRATYNETSTASRVKIVAMLPADTKIDGQTLCSVAGAVIRKKVGAFPKDEFDGIFVKKILTDEIFYDEDVENNNTYCYAAFPFTTQGVYNRNVANRSVCTVKVGCTPGDMKTFTAKSAYSNGQARVRLNAILPDNGTAESPYTIAGAVICRSTTGYPVDEFDGSQVMNITANGIYYDLNVEVGITYYYAAFPFTTDSMYNRNVVSANHASCEVVAREYLFGYDLAQFTPNPAARVSYPSDVDNADFLPAAMNFDTGVFNYGSWPSTPGEMFMPRPCMLTFAGIVDHYLDPNDYTKKIDGTVSRVADRSFGGNAMMEWPKIYTKRWEENGVYKFRCSDVPQDDTWLCWCNYGSNSKEIDHFYTSIYFGTSYNDSYVEPEYKLRSISGETAFVDGTTDIAITRAQANGDDWYIEVLADRLLIQDLLVMMAKTTECQTAYGYGSCYTYDSNALCQGTMNTKGLFWGSNDKTSGVKVFGMENWWGNLWRRTAGYIIVDGTQKVKLTRGIKDGSTVYDYNMDGHGYITINSAPFSGVSGGYISTMMTNAFGRLPIESDGSATTYEADGVWYDNINIYYACFGGNRLTDLSVGPFCVALSIVADYGNAGIGAALSCKPCKL